MTPKDKDEAHIAYGFAKHLRDGLPNASFIGFTGTPIERADKSTLAVFGEYIDIYDIQRAVEDGATVKILYEGRLAKIELQESERPKIDPDFEDVTEGEEQTVNRVGCACRNVDSATGRPTAESGATSAHRPIQNPQDAAM